MSRLDLIKENDYCRIYGAEANGLPLIIKKYKGSDPALAEAEARGVDLYHRMVRGDPHWIDSKTIRLVVPQNLVCLGHIEGEPFRSFLLNVGPDEKLRKLAFFLLTQLGRLLERLYESTQSPGADTSPFIFEYLHYCSAELERLPVVGPIAFKGYRDSAVRLEGELRGADLTPSFVHGDLVFQNMHVSGDRIGLFDFANTNDLSHLLNDYYNLMFNLATIRLPRSFKKGLMRAFATGLSGLSFCEAAHRFYYEYQRRRWLMLRAKNVTPSGLLQAVAGRMAFAKPFDPEGLGEWLGTSGGLSSRGVGEVAGGRARGLAP